MHAILGYNIFVVDNVILYSSSAKLVSTASRLLSEVKHDLARLVLRWGTTLESLVLFFLSFALSFAATM
jgi:hypothetical protein